MSEDKIGKEKKSKRRESKGESEPEKTKKGSHHADVLDSVDLTVPAVPKVTSSSAKLLKASSAFEKMYPVLNLPIPPVWSNDPYAAFSDLMDTLVMRYVPQLSGVLITHTPTRFLQDTAVFTAESAFATASVGFECIVWRPKIGQVLEGTICLSSPSHVSMLLYGIFNASIPASHLPEEEWEYVVDEADGSGSHQDQDLGHWRRRSDGSKLGGQEGKLSFTVISLTIANHMLSLHGSLLEEPFAGPAPTFDRSYLKKSLLPTHALGLGSIPAASSAESTDEGRHATPRRVRWQDEDEVERQDNDDSSSESDPESRHTAYDAEIQVSGRKATKRKSLSTVDTDDDGANAQGKRREKKRPKQA